MIDIIDNNTIEMSIGNNWRCTFPYNYNILENFVMQLTQEAINRKFIIFSITEDRKNFIVIRFENNIAKIITAIGKDTSDVISISDSNELKIYNDFEEYITVIENININAFIRNIIKESYNDLTENKDKWIEIGRNPSFYDKTCSPEYIRKQSMNHINGLKKRLSNCIKKYNIE